MGDFTAAALISIETAAMENAARGKVDGGGNLTFQFNMLGFFAAEFRNGT